MSTEAEVRRAVRALTGGSPAATGARARLATVVRTLSGQEPPTDPRGLVASFDDLLAGAAPDATWLTLAVLQGAMPRDAEVLAHVRAVALDGPLTGFADVLAGPRAPWRRAVAGRDVEVLSDVVLVDLAHTSRTSLATGIQRVARQTARRWADAHDVVLVGWTADGRALRRLTPDEVRVALHGGPVPSRALATDRVVLPWRATYVLPELATEQERTERILALARWSGSRTGVVGFDCVPITSAETIGTGMGAAFAQNLAAVRHMDRVATISHAAAGEYRGWRRMLTGAGLDGPEIAPVVLPVEAQPASAEDVRRARSRFAADGLPVALCVGSHEPRKNHLAVLQAAELAWRSGSRFRLLFVGGNAWGSQTFERRLKELAAAGRPVSAVSALSDDELWALYALARFVVFPSLNEGFGLPVAEAIATGTPVLTSDFGSMREIAEGRGGLLVDPRDDVALARGLRRLADDDELLASLTAEAVASPARTWDEYAAQTWDYLVAGTAAGTTTGAVGTARG
ncbi:glycosyltransferase family 4 protein [Cellulomonas wangsupingiae]|uniref:Glycosyltransferase family 4 protein n=1 Tax=Cellulomonas wangsupingiae TaxID=2968085 RepID=A0ABY5K1N2_9CELL|nr:glycosyltransferase family 1 protein [Cellulomonas wangsupingiae]MCC2335680.1 glycosyltransferase family 4 protein [Cellulomonas wangsupingiae]UUI63915.1 glycosyltransferase family 4 protein [Cellulomonas wangsupingiae]